MLRHYLQWHIIHSCNLCCKHCYQEDNTAAMNYDSMLRFLDKYGEYVALHSYEPQINLTGGEPLLHPDFYKIAGEIRRRNIRLGILTNGTLIDPEAAKKLAALKPVFVQVSLDGPKQIHGEIRGEGAFERALKGIDLLKKEGVRVLVSFTAMKSNYTSLKELAKICKSHKVDKLWWDRGVTDDENLFLTTEEFKQISEEAAKLSRRYKNLNCGRALQGLPTDTCGYQCSAGKRLLIVLANGDMMACRRLPFVIGNISEVEKLEETLRNNQIMNELSSSRIPSDCTGCRHLSKCRGGAKCVTFAQTGKLGIKDVNCYL